MTIGDAIIVLGLAGFLAYVAVVLVRDARDRRDGKRDREAWMSPEEEPDQVELPDHRIVDRELAQIIGAPTTAWAESERMQYRPEDFKGKIHCLSCQREILPGQWFWDTPLLNRQTRLPLDGGPSFQTCLSCQPGDAEANTRGQ